MWLFLVTWLADGIGKETGVLRTLFYSLSFNLSMPYKAI